MFRPTMSLSLMASRCLTSARSELPCAAISTRLPDAARREIHIGPAGEAVFPIPRRLAVSQQHQLVHCGHYNDRLRMDFVRNNLLLFVVALVSGGMLLWPLVRRTTGGPWVNAAQATHLIN